MKKITSKKYLPALIVIAFALIAVVGGVRLLSKIKQNRSNSQTSGEKISVQDAKATASVNREFSFPIKDSSNKKITDLKFIIESAELRDEIIVKGSRATAVKGRTFLILNLKITNNFNKALQINTQDYFRLTVNNSNDDLLAPDIHNDPLIIQPTSTKFTRVGFAINDSDKNIVLQVGEIDGEKTKIELNLQ